MLGLRKFTNNRFCEGPVCAGGQFICNRALDPGGPWRVRVCLKDLRRPWHRRFCQSQAGTFGEIKRPHTGTGSVQSLDSNSSPVKSPPRSPLPGFAQMGGSWLDEEVSGKAEDENPSVGRLHLKFAIPSKSFDFVLWNFSFFFHMSEQVNTQ